MKFVPPLEQSRGVFYWPVTRLVNAKDFNFHSLHCGGRLAAEFPEASPTTGTPTRTPAGPDPRAAAKARSQAGNPSTGQRQSDYRGGKGGGSSVNHFRRDQSNHGPACEGTSGLLCRTRARRPPAIRPAIRAMAQPIPDPCVNRGGKLARSEHDGSGGRPIQIMASESRPLADSERDLQSVGLCDEPK